MKSEVKFALDRKTDALAVSDAPGNQAAPRARSFILRIIVVHLVAGVSPVMSDASGELIQFFESELSERAIAYRALDDGRYELAIDTRQLVIGLDNLSRRYANDQDEQVISDFVDSIVGSLQPIPEWKEARHNVFTLLETTDLEIDDQVIHRELSRLAQIIPVYYDEKSGSIKFITVSQVDAWGINHEQVWQAAESALDRIMQKTEVSYLDIEVFQLGMIGAADPYKASLIRAPSLRSKVEGQLGWPIYALAPSRSYVFLLGKSDFKQLSRVAPTIVKEFKNSEYPLSTEVWEVTDDGIKSIGAIPVD